MTKTKSYKIKFVPDTTDCILRPIQFIFTFFFYFLMKNQKLHYEFLYRSHHKMLHDGISGGQQKKIAIVPGVAFAFYCIRFVIIVCHNAYGYNVTPGSTHNSRNNIQPCLESALKLRACITKMNIMYAI